MANNNFRQALRFVGIQDVRLVGAERAVVDARAARASALATLEQWLPSPSLETV